LGRTGAFDLAVAPPFRPKEPSSANAQRFLDEARTLERSGATWIWTSLPAPSLNGFLEIIDWFGREVIAEYSS
jgi:hypothetical protein